MKFGVIVFPGSNCDDDILHVIQSVMECEIRKIWHKEEHLDDFTTDDCIIVPGGFAYGDYLRAGAIARFSPIMQAVIAFANNGGYVWGICNGFQVLCEAQLLPGALLRNESQKFICKNVFLRVESSNSSITRNLSQGDIIKVPIAHAEGRYFAHESTLSELKQNDQILFTYCADSGVVNKDFNPNGSKLNIAGICNKQRNVFGMMPHPERCAESLLGNNEGKKLFDSLVFKEMLTP